MRTPAMLAIPARRAAAVIRIAAIVASFAIVFAILLAILLGIGTMGPASAASDQPSLALLNEPSSSAVPAAQAAQTATGVSTEPWVLAALATGLLFFGYTTAIAFRPPGHQARPGQRNGHAQLDALGFD